MAENKNQTAPTVEKPSARIRAAESLALSALKSASGDPERIELMRRIVDRYDTGMALLRAIAAEPESTTYQSTWLSRTGADNSITMAIRVLSGEDTARLGDAVDNPNIRKVK